MIIDLPNLGYLLIESKIFETLDNYRQLKPSDYEAGGVLIGEYRGHHLRLINCSVPDKADGRTRNGFYRRSKRHQQLVDQCWKQSGSLTTWVGEWHSHPEDYPTPSALDRSSWEKCFPCRPMVMIIQGRKDRWIGLYEDNKIHSLNLGPNKLVGWDKLANPNNHATN